MGLKKDSVFIFLLTIILIASIAAFAFVYYISEIKVFEEIRICIGNESDSKIPCKSDNECRDIFKEQESIPDISNAPELIKEGFDKIFEEASYCEGTCKFREVRGFNFKTYENERLPKCEPGETEFLFKIKGKDALEIINFLESIS